MASIETKTRAAEYVSLREELDRNKRYIFERPLVIIAAFGISAFELYDQRTGVFLPALLVAFLVANLWLTVNRIRSSARISAYIDVVLEETKKDKWIGWERSLRKYRLWMKSNDKDEQEKLIGSNFKKSAVPDSMMFYTALYSIHVAVGMLALGGSGVSMGLSWDGLHITAFGFTVVAWLLLMYLCIGSHHPSKIHPLIERCRATWLEVL